MIEKIGNKERLVLTLLVESFEDEANCYYIRGIANNTGLTEKEARRAVRSLARKGLTAHIKGLFDDEGMVAGSGYSATLAGCKFIEREKDLSTKEVPNGN